MANNKPKFNVKRLNNLVDTVSTRMNDIYRRTYNSDKGNYNDLNTITKKIDDNISNIINRNGDADISNISKIYSRLKLKDSVTSKEFENSVLELFNDDQLTGTILNSYIGNKWIRDLDNEIDTICRYMPKLEEALMAKRDAVLSSDNFSKEFITATSNISSDEQILFAKRIEDIKDKYNLESKFEKYYENTSKYGEQFIYIVPYNKAFETLLRNKENTNKFRSASIEHTIIENGIIKSSIDNYEKMSSIMEENKGAIPNNFKIIFDNSNLLYSVLEEHQTILDIQNNSYSDIHEAYVSSIHESKMKFDKIVDDALELPEKFEKTSSDGLIDISNRHNSNSKVKVPGCIVKKLKRENVIPIYIRDTCMGYYYIEFMRGNGFDDYNKLMDSRNTMSYSTPLTKTMSDGASEEQMNYILAYISNQISNNIDSTFINNNPDLKKEIYAILKHNDIFNSTQDVEAMRCTFIPADDIVHMAFNIDEDTHRGLSDLLRGLIPAKLYSCLYITNTLGILSRGQDKRVYYVKQGVETNIAQTLLNVINQIKKNNFNIRQIENMNSILNITGRFNDYLVPVGPSGDSPIQFEVIPSQEFNPYTELMEALEEMAINSTDVPLDQIQSRLSADYATQITQSNTKFLRHVYKRQSICEYYFSKILTKIYNYEYGTNIEIKVELPTPLFLNMNNMQQIMSSTQEYVNSIANFEFGENLDDEKQAIKEIFVKKMMRKQLSTYIKVNEVERLINEAEMEYSENKKKESNDDL